MDSKPPQNAPRKHKFKPRAPPLPLPKAEVKTEKVEDVDANRAMELMRQFHERSIKSKAKVEKKVNASQIAFGMGAASTSLKSYGVPNGGSASDKARGLIELLHKLSHNSTLEGPYSGNPAILDKEEFGDGSKSEAYNENAISSAAELGLLEENVEPRMFLLQLSPTMPMVKQSANASGQDVKETSNPKGTCRFNELPAGYMGKMLIYKTGDVKLKLGDTLFDVSAGMKCIFAQDVVAVNTAEKHCCVVGEIERRVILKPDIDNMPNL